MNGFHQIVLDANQICKNGLVEENQIENINQYLLQGRDVIVHTGEKKAVNLSSEVLGKVLGTISKEAVTKAKLKRVVVAGGDTSSYTARAMEIEALEMIAPLIPGAPLCKVYSANEGINGLEVNLKGGQVGGEDYFLIMKKGSVSVQ